ncbi:hypothetical protein [Leclercia sp. W17]|uniref:hypothetical protein n=1 Tax=Leclercia sp. W17 TaxID=2282309 RepID=UPI000DF2FD48|nr:hypothetical protein [Leclercia sp. W17]AXF64446.1 hypothetical protein DVA44_10150 [Leclercia sp. W17]
MSDSLNNKELVAVGHQFAKAMSSDTAIMDIAKIVSRLAERLDCATLALRDAMAAENAGLKECTVNHAHAVEHWNSWADAEDKIPPAPETPATDAYLAEVRAQGADAVADQHRRKYEELKPINVFFAKDHKEAQRVAEFVAAQLRQGDAK